MNLKKKTAAAMKRSICNAREFEQKAIRKKHVETRNYKL